MPRLLNLLVLASAFLTILSQTSSAQTSITLSEKTGPPTATLSVSGTGFQPNDAVDIYFDNEDEAQAFTNDQGQFVPTQISVPGTAKPGNHSVSAVGENNGGNAHTGFIVNTDWSQVGFDPAQTNFNPYENVLDPQNVVNLGILWTTAFGDYGFGSEFATAYEGRVYVSWVDGGGPGTLDAFEQTSGMEGWTTVGPDSSAVFSRGLAYSVSDSGVLSALNARTGNSAGEFSFGGTDYPPEPPVVADGEILFLTTSGYLYAVEQRTGKQLWRFGTGYLSYGDSSVPAVNNGIIYVCANVCYGLTEGGHKIWASTGSILTPATSASLVVVSNFAG